MNFPDTISQTVKPALTELVARASVTHGRQVVLAVGRGVYER